MKNTIIVIVLMVSMLITGCSKLDLVPISQKSVEGFYRTESHINQAINGIYSTLRTVWVNGNQSYMLTESRSDNAFQPTMAYDDGQINQFIETPLLPVLNTAWATYYAGIHQCNKILESLNNVQLEDETRRRYEGEAKFGRAMFYFDLVRLFGGVPIVTTSLSVSESYTVDRAELEAVYDLIVSDLSFAVESLPETYAASDEGRATKWAAYGYLGKVHLFRSGYPLKKNEFNEAKDAFLAVINSGNFEFFDSYAAIYDFENEGGKQQVFSIKFKAAASGNGNAFPTRNASNDIQPVSVDQGGLPFGGSPFNLFISGDLMDSFEEGDIRKSVAIRSEWLHKSGEIIRTLPTCQKYQNGPVAAANDWDIDWIALSYTDILMMYAECLNELGYQPDGEAFQILNRVRVRAGLQEKTKNQVPDQQSFRLWMETERRHEFCFENLRWFDLVRTDRGVDVMTAFLDGYGMEGNMTGTNKYLYPIPQSVLEMTPHIQQNP